VAATGYLCLALRQKRLPSQNTRIVAKVNLSLAPAGPSRVARADQALVTAALDDEAPDGAAFLLEEEVSHEKHKRHENGER